ncbi:hypothetical protein [Metabacillus sediminilitoris]|nr:hypothetical protein [Metabacillus sediminilitoris]
MNALKVKNLLTPDYISPDDPIFIAGIKLLADGSVSGRTAWLAEPFV